MTTTMLYRPADEPNPDVWGLNIEHRVFADADVDEAVADGWARHPNDVGASSDADPQPKRRGRPPKEG